MAAEVLPPSMTSAEGGDRHTEALYTSDVTWSAPDATDINSPTLPEHHRILCQAVHASTVLEPRTSALSWSRVIALRTAVVMLWQRGYALALNDGQCDVDETGAEPTSDAGVLAAAIENVRPSTLARHARPLAASPGFWLMAVGRGDVLERDGVPTSISLQPAMDDTLWVVMLSPEEGGKISKSSTAALMHAAFMGGVTRLLILVQSTSSFTYHCAQAVREKRAWAETEGRPDITTEVIGFSSLIDIKPLHILVPHLRPVPWDRVPETLKKWRQTGSDAAHANGLPSFEHTDVMVRWFAFPLYTLIEYTAHWGHGTRAFERIRRVTRAPPRAQTKSSKISLAGAAQWLVL